MGVNNIIGLSLYANFFHFNTRKMPSPPSPSLKVREHCMTEGSSEIADNT